MTDTSDRSIVVEREMSLKGVSTSSTVVVVSSSRVE